MDIRANRYRILPLNHRHSFVLRADKDILGTITLKGLHRGSALINIEGKELSIKRTSSIRKNLEMKNGFEEFRFHADLLSRGEISIRTHHYKWGPTNLGWTSWAWKNLRGDILMEIKIKRTFTGVRGEITSLHPLDSLWKMEIAMIGWYLLLLGHGRPGIHLLSALNVATTNKKNRD